jgi:hypothetical protein
MRGGVAGRGCYAAAHSAEPAVHAFSHFALGDPGVTVFYSLDIGIPVWSCELSAIELCAD